MLEPVIKWRNDQINTLLANVSNTNLRHLHPPRVVRTTIRYGAIDVH